MLVPNLITSVKKDWICPIENCTDLGPVAFVRSPESGEEFYVHGCGLEVSPEDTDNAVCDGCGTQMAPSERHDCGESFEDPPVQDYCEDCCPSCSAVLDHAMGGAC